MKYILEITSCDMIHTKFHKAWYRRSSNAKVYTEMLGITDKDCFRHSKVIQEDIHTHHRQDDLISLLLLVENKENRLKYFCSQTKQHILTLINIITLKE